ncbi:MAG: NAD(P)/FAD-dependent oxidoreductase [Cyanobacteriota bacterium]|nr:NAD(P)/FAD-dependent oxidoreductase [Cyanobacteriota bacterium]
MCTPSTDTTTLVIGAGPGGLTAAYTLSQAGYPVTVFEQDPQFVGGISRTVVYQGYRFDIGGHRFFSKSQEVEQFWTEILGSEMLVCQRLSRIYYNQKFFDYPLRPLDAFAKLGFSYTLLCILSYLKARFQPRPSVTSFEDWVINQFGERLYYTFFKTYTEKVWGIPCQAISADWAAQRIKGLSMGSLIRNTLFPQRTHQKNIIKTLIDQFRYPRLGPGQMWEQVHAHLQANHHPVLLGHQVNRIFWDPSGILGLQTLNTKGETCFWSGSHIISTMPLRSLIRALDPAPPSDVIVAAESLKYRDFLTVAIILDQPNLFPDHWIYIHDPNVQVGRIQNFKNWSPDLVPNLNYTCLGLEYFCFIHNQLWQMSDTELLKLASDELLKLGLRGDPQRPAQVIDGTVVRVPKAYPVYDHHYKSHVDIIRTYLQKTLPNLQLVGRNGMHRYNNQDHAMMTGMLAAENIILGEFTYDLWQVNQDAVYLEQGEAGSQALAGRLVPRPLRPLESERKSD